MTQKEIIDVEQSAFAFCTRIKAYNVLRTEPGPYVLLSVNGLSENGHFSFNLLLSKK